MKLINCSKCNAKIGLSSSSDKFTVCNYCGTKTFTKDDNDSYSSNQFLSNYNPTGKETLFDQWVMNVEDDEWDEQTNKRFAVIGIVLAIIAVIFLPFLLVKEFKEKKEKVTVQKTPPPISYHSTVQYADDVNAELIEKPFINLENLTPKDVEVLRETNFLQRKILVELVIDESGKVIQVTALNGHPLLKESSVQAAKKSLFSPRKRKTTVVLTYIFTIN